MRIATWNVNSVRSRIDRVEALLTRHQIDVLALQETKARDDQWPTMGLEALGYDVATLGHNQWNGVAIVSRVGLEDVERGFAGMPEFGDPLAAEARAIGATCGGVRLWSLYVPNGRALGDPHHAYNLSWLEAMGYEVATYGLNQWNGVAIASRVGLADVQRGFAGMPTYGDPAAAEARAIGATCGGVRVWSLYVPNGRAVGDPHLDYKLAWLGALRDAAGGWLAEEPDRQVALTGDWNIAPRDEDVFDMAQFTKSTHVTPPERAAFQAIVDAGFADVVRPHTPGPGVYGRTRSAYPVCTIASKAARSGGVTCVLFANTLVSHTSSSVGAMFQSPVSAICASGSDASQPCAASLSASSHASL